MIAKLLAVLLLTIQVCLAQNPAKVLHLQQQIDKAKSDSDKVVALGELASYYYIYRLEKKADSILRIQLNIAELSHSKNLVFATLFGKAVSNINPWSSIETLDRTMSFIQQGLDYATEAGRDDYIALAYIRKANLLRKRGQYNNAIQQATLAFSSIGNQEFDSVKAVLYIELGDIYKDNKNAVNAYNNFTNALSIAEQLKSIPLQSEVYHHLGELYHSIEYKELAKNNILKSLQLNTENKNLTGILNDYIDLARFTDQKIFFDKARHLADSLKSDRHILQSKSLMLAYYYVVEKATQKALYYLHSNDDLDQYYKNQGEANYLYNLANIYKYSNIPDTALYYYKLAEPVMESNFDVRTRRSVYREMAESYTLLKQHENAIIYFEKALALAKDIGEYGTISKISHQLSGLYAQTGNYHRAYQYNVSHLAYQDSLKELVNNRSLVLLEVKKDEEKRKKEAEEMTAKQIRKQNIQYMAITIATAIIFVFMILGGMFPISKFVVKVLGFFAFICLFEFIILLIDVFLHNITHGEPLKIWLIKIFIIAILLPLHHYLEHIVVKFLASEKLMQMRKEFTLKHWWQAIKKPASKKEAGLETDTTVDTAVM